MELSRYYEGRRSRRWLTISVAMVAAGVTAFAVYEGMASSPKAAAVSKADRPATVEAIGKAGRTRVVLRATAAKRLGIHTGRAGDDALRRRAASRNASGRISRVRTAACRDPDHLSRVVRVRSGRSRHRSIGAGAAGN